ncbi:MAG: PfkB family carbohydrate kinase, partial [Kiritimatiellae bacterium]|nr:PfkB family carbohydrate kinase [Kiritimatiellia bacterium]
MKTRPDSTLPILSLGLTPALQRTLRFDDLRLGGVNRARGVVESAAGKAVNVGLALAVLGDAALVTGFNGGHTGCQVDSDLRRRGVTQVFTLIRQPTRICTTILQPAYEATELVEESPPLTAGDLRQFRRDALRLLASCRALAISGTLPPSVDN